VEGNEMQSPTIDNLTVSLPRLEEAEAQVSTLCELFDRAVATAPDGAALRHSGVTLTYREMGRAVSSLARRLAEIVAPGDVVALVLPNSIEFHIAYFAALKALAGPALLNPLYPSAQLLPLLRDVAPRAVICVPATRDMMASLTHDLSIPGLVCLGQDITVPDLIAETEVPVRIRAATPTDSGALFFSGGTTGLPKAVEHTHGRLIHAMRGIEHIFPPRGNHEVFLAIVPFTHVYGFLLGVLVPISARGEMVIAERFQPEHIVELLERHHVTFFGGGPPAIYAGVLAARNLGTADLSALKVCPGGGAPFPVELMARWRRVTGLQIREGYGMTEVVPISGPTEESGMRPGSVGKPVPGCEVQVVDLDSGVRVLPRGERGELRVRGPQMMAGYRNRPEETAQTIRDGFIYTGDIGYLDEDGFLFITDRKKDVVLVKGFNVFPREVEEVINTHPNVGMVGVVGVPDARTAGERLVAFVVPRPGETVDEAEISAHCTSRLVSYKCPAEVRVVEQLPMTNIGKLDRVALRQAVSVGQSLRPALDDRVPAGSAQSGEAL
jgi:long-chain acyl-CoA synthetase